MSDIAVKLEAHAAAAAAAVVSCTVSVRMCEEVACIELDCSAVDPVPWPYSVHVGVGA